MKRPLEEPFVRGVFQQSPHQVRHSGQKLPDRGVFAYREPHLHERALDRFPHAVQHLELVPLPGDLEPLRRRQRLGDRPHVVGADGKRHVLVVFQGDLHAPLEIRVGVRFPGEDGDLPPLLPSHDGFVFPVGPLHQADRDAADFLSFAQPISRRRSRSAHFRYAWRATPAWSHPWNPVSSRVCVRTSSVISFRL